MTGQMFYDKAISFAVQNRKERQKVKKSVSGQIKAS